MWLADRLANLVSGLGGPRDKSTGNLHVHVPRARAELDAAYRDNWLARKVVDIVPFDMLREWRAWQAPPEVAAALPPARRASPCASACSRPCGSRACTAVPRS